MIDNATLYIGFVKLGVFGISLAIVFFLSISIKYHTIARLLTTHFSTRRDKQLAAFSTIGVFSTITALTIFFKDPFTFLFLTGGVGILLLFIWVVDKKYYPITMAFLWWALVIMLLFHIFHFQLSDSHFLYGYDDDAFFERGVSIGNTLWNHMKIKLFLGTHPGYNFTIAYIWYAARFFSTSVGLEIIILIKALNCFVAALLLLILAKLAENTFSQKVSKTFITIYFFSPFILFYSSIIMRDIIVALCISCIIFFSFEAETKKLHWITVAVFWLLLASFRFQSCILLTLILGTYFILRRFTARSQAIIGITLLISGSILAGILISQKLSIGIGAKRIDLYHNFIERTQDNVNQTATDSLGGKLLSYPYPIRFLPVIGYFILTPIPPSKISYIVDHHYSPEELFPIAYAIHWYILIPLFILGMVESISSKDKKKKILFWIVSSFIFGLSFSSIDPRHKLTIIGLMYIMSAYGAHILLGPSLSPLKRRIFFLAKFYLFFSLIFFLYIKFVLLE